jgi:hypothetical protein
MYTKGMYVRHYPGLAEESNFDINSHGCKKTMIILFEETNLFINFRATSSGSNCSKNIYTTTDFNKYVSPVYDSVLPETNETDNVSPVYDSVLPETNETDNKSFRTSCVIPNDT